MPKNFLLKLVGYVGDYAFDADFVRWSLERKSDTEVDVLIDSIGGQVNSGISIRSAFIQHGKVNVHITGMTASAATIAAMGAKHISMDSAALLLIHPCTAWVDEFEQMNSEQLQQLIEQLESQRDNQKTIDRAIVGVYEARCKKSHEDLVNLFQSEKWLTAQEALEWGFVDEITDLAEDEAPELTDEIVDAFVAEGIPLPPVRRRPKSFFSRLADFFSSQAQSIQPPVEINSNSNIPPVMINYTNLSNVAGAPVEAEEGAAVSIPADRAAAINDAISSRDQRISELESRISELETQPAESTDQVVDESRGNGERPINHSKAAEEFLNIFK